MLQFFVCRARTHSMIVMIRLILSSLCLTTVNCQLAYIWLNYNLFQCTQNARNYHASIHHQYLCTVSFIWTCISDVNEYSHSSVIVPQSFCGFIDGRNALQRHTIWNIHIKPNINIHFLKFELFDNYWYCDYEYLKVSGNNKSSTFCGNRLPWVHDAADTSVNIILMTHVQRAGTKNYQLELLYYGAYVPNYEHFVIFIQPSSVINKSPLIDKHLPNREQNAFESFHFIASNRLDIVELEAITCNKGHVVCYDGPGFKSPALQFTYNQSVQKCQSSTFQMMCRFSRVYSVCTKGSRLYYHAVQDHVTEKLHFRKCPSHPLEINESKSKGTTKYIYSYGSEGSGKLKDCMIHFIKMDLSFPYMLSEGNSCMYGGLFIEQYGSEILSLCTSSLNMNRRYVGLHRLIITHYSEYSAERILFYAEHSDSRNVQHKPGLFQQSYKEDTLSMMPSQDFRYFQENFFISFLSSLFRLRKILYINITINDSAVIKFDAQYSSPCVNVIIFYITDLSNMWFIQDYHYKVNGSWNKYDGTTTSGHRSLKKTAFIEYVIINMSDCSFVRDPVWEVFIKVFNYGNVIGYPKLPGGYFGIERLTLPASVLYLDYLMYTTEMNAPWLLLHMQKPEDVPLYAIWGVWIDSRHIELHTFIEVLVDYSSSWYTWGDSINHKKLYIIVNKAVNIQLKSNYVGLYKEWFQIVFTRDLHDERITKYITGQTPQQLHFSFHNQR